MTHHVVSIRTNLIVFGALLGLLGLTILAANFLPLHEPWNLLVAMAIASTKAMLILLYFMHVRYSDRLTWVFSGAGLIWLAILIGLSLTDYATRDWMTVQGK